MCIKFELRGFRIESLTVEVVPTPGCGGHVHDLVVRLACPNVLDREQTTQVQRRTRVVKEQLAKPDEVFHQIMAALRHEVEECFYVDGERWRDPHDDDQPHPYPFLEDAPSG